jgi:hypothetical protein
MNLCSDGTGASTCAQLVKSPNDVGRDKRDIIGVPGFQCWKLDRSRLGQRGDE